MNSQRSTSNVQSEEIQSLNPIGIPLWNDLVARFPGVGVFHSAGWAAVLNHTYGHRPSYWIAGPADHPAAIFPLITLRSPVTGSRSVCLPLVDFCAPLLQPGARCQPLWEAIRSAGRGAGWRYVEWRGEAPVPGATSAITFHAHLLDLRPGRDAVLRGFDSPVQRAVRKAEAAGLHVRFGTVPEDVEAYYRLHCLTRRRHGLPPQPKRFFDEIGEHLLREGHGFVALAYARKTEPPEQPLAAAVFLHFGRRAVYKFGASDLRYQELRANNLVMSQSIQHCIELGMEEIHFGRTNAEQEGLRRFKRGWGAREEPLHYYRYGLKDGTWQSSRSRTTGWHNRVFRHLPLAVSRLLGEILYRHVD